MEVCTLVDKMEKEREREERGKKERVRGGKLLMKNRNSSRGYGDDRSEVFTWNLHCEFNMPVHLYFVPALCMTHTATFSGYLLCYGFESVADYSTHIPVSNLPRVYLSCYLLTYYQPNVVLAPSWLMIKARMFLFERGEEKFWWTSMEH